MDFHVRGKRDQVRINHVKDYGRDYGPHRLYETAAGCPVLTTHFLGLDMLTWKAKYLLVHGRWSIGLCYF